MEKGHVLSSLARLTVSMDSDSGMQLMFRQSQRKASRGLQSWDKAYVCTSWTYRLW